MAWVVKYSCTSCAHRWTSKKTEKGLLESCPMCRYKPEEKEHDFTKFSTMPIYNGKHSKAADIAYGMIEKDYGMTNLKDNLKEGDVAAVSANPVQQVMQQRGGFFGGGGPQNVMQGRGDAMQMAAAAKQQRLSEKSMDPVSYAQNVFKKEPSIIDRARAQPFMRSK